MSISYQLEKKALKPATIKVYNGRKHIGNIDAFEGGYRYKPKGGGKDNVGETFDTVAAVKRSLEG
ncbi:hypothetical protein EVB39_053 [Rhizobium phage RHph_TM3_3_9]|nr:hypothetical protein EVB39_053 [Rhizobium phage RHph_TM3_3_9]QIG68574.1 hypothetical protein EVB66_053 [Rhizobium phage RHph_TM3_3_13]QIG74432.1 hypothetical protein EVC09_052 [Rhizobium phage RHph_TM3_3_10]QXV74546.1 hypothetical protein [Rhizobium phage RHEph19]